MNQLEYKIPSLLYKFLACKGRVHIPGLGTIQVTRKSAKNNFADKIMQGYDYQFEFNSITSTVPDDQLLFLERHCSLSVNDLLHHLEDLKKEVIQKLTLDRKLEWIDVGSFSKGEDGQLTFQPKQQTIEYTPSVSYSHVIRESASHAVLVGESERSSEEMETFFEEQKRGLGNRQWRLPALVLGILAIALLFIRFSFGNFKPFESRYNLLKPLSPPETYSIR